MATSTLKRERSVAPLSGSSVEHPPLKRMRIEVPRIKPSAVSVEPQLTTSCVPQSRTLSSLAVPASRHHDLSPPSAAEKPQEDTTSVADESSSPSTLIDSSTSIVEKASQIPSRSRNSSPIDSASPPSHSRLILQRHQRDVFDIIWSSNKRAFRDVGLDELLSALGLFTGTREEVWAFLRQHREVIAIYKRVQTSCDVYELCTYPLFNDSLDSVIEDALTKCDQAFSAVRQGILPHDSLCSLPDIETSSLRHLRDLDGPGSVQDIQHVERIFALQKAYITASMTAKTRLLAQGLLRHWGFHFSFSATGGSDHHDLESPPISQDLALALRLFTASASGASAKPKPMDRSMAAGHYFHALYLTRIIVLAEFLESLPADIDLSADQARKEWLYFQLNPPRISPQADLDLDIFGFIFQAIIAHGTRPGTTERLRWCAKRRMCSMAWRRFRWFEKSFFVTKCGGKSIPSMDVEGEQPPFRLVVDEVGMPLNPGAEGSGTLRRAARRRRAVCELFWSECISSS